MKRTNLQTFKHSPKRILSLLLVLVLLCTALPRLSVPASADDYSGTCGDNLTWSFDPDTGLLTIEGSGAMNSAPWAKFKTQITQLSLPVGLTRICMIAFSGCTGLSAVSLPEGLTTIAKSAFKSCTGLTAVTFPEGLATIGETAFENCTGLTEISLPESLSSVGKEAFMYCTGLRAVSVYSRDCTISDPSDSRRYTLGDPNVTVLYGYEGSTTQAFAERYGYAFFPLGVDVLSGECGAEGDNLTWTMDVHTKLLTIEGSGAMANYSSSQEVPWKNFRTQITGLFLPEGLTGIGSSAFSGCTGLSAVSLPEGLTGIGSYAFSGCTGLSAVSLPEGLTGIGSSAFSGCTGLTEITVKNYGCTIEDSYFTLGVPGRTTVYGYTYSTAQAYAEKYGYSFISLGTLEQLSGECGAEGDNLLWMLNTETGLLTITGAGEMKNFDYQRAPWYTARAIIRTVVFPQGITGIGSYAFYGCTGLSAVSLPAGLTSIGSSAFSGCTGLSSIEFPESLTSIDGGAFSNCTGLSSIEFPESLTSIGGGAFSNCTGLSSVTLPEGLASIGSGAFSYCTGLTSVTLPSTLEFLLMGGMWEFAAGPFENCENLTALVFRNPNTYVQTGGDCDTGEDLNLGEYDNAKKALGVLEKTVLYAAETSVPSSYCDYEEPGIFKNLPTYAADYGYTLYRLGMFSDVKEGKWYEIPVAWAYGKGITSGTGEGTFSPHDPCKREQIVTFIWKAYGSPTPGGTELPFTDLKAGKYYMDAVRWAYYHDPQITSGIAPGVFGVGETCTRGQVVTFLWNAAGRPEPEDAENPFNDVKESDYYYKAVLWAVENGITSGTSPTTFGPKDPCTRAHVVSFLYKAVG